MGYKAKRGNTCIIAPLNEQSYKATFKLAHSNQIFIEDDEHTEKVVGKRQLKYLIFPLEKKARENYNKYLKIKSKERILMKKSAVNEKNDFLSDKLGRIATFVFTDGKQVSEVEIVNVSLYEILVIKDNKEMIIYKHALKSVKFSPEKETVQ